MDRSIDRSINRFHVGPLILVELEFKDVSFCGAKENRRTRRKTLGARRELTTNSNYIWHRVGIEPSPHW